MISWKKINWGVQETADAGVANLLLGESRAEHQRGRPRRRVGGHLGEMQGPNLVQCCLRKIHAETLGASVTQLWLLRVLCEFPFLLCFVLLVTFFHPL